jgi:6,7-dimethyl-8-ribityllumazine synthase
MTEPQTVLVVEGRFYQDIADEMARGAVRALDAAGVQYQRLAVPGAFEVPAAIRLAIRSMELGAAPAHYAGFVALGCVIRGETTHYDYVCNETSRALMDLAVAHSIALGYGILTCENRNQAWARAAADDKDKGGDVARACLRMMEVKRDLHLTLR